MRRWGALCLAAALAVGCGRDEAPDPREEAFMASVEAVQEVRELERRGLPPSRETLRRAYDLGLAALRLDGKRPRVELLSHLSNVCLELGRDSPEHLARAVRFADHAIREAPGWIVPRFNLGVAFARAGLLEKSAREFRACLRMREDLLRENPGSRIEDPGAREGLKAVLVAQANRALARDRVDAELSALRAAEEAWKLDPDAGRNRQAYELLARLNQDYAARANAAIERGDDLETARIHASFGHFVPALEALDRARRRLGRTGEVRWVEVRYLEELEGGAESLARAVSHYEDLITLGERVVHASAGLARCLRASGRGEEAFERLHDFPEPSPELRRELVLLRLDRLRALGVGDAGRADEEFRGIEELLRGDLDPEDRATSMLEVAGVALERGEGERLTELVREFLRWYPQDRRIVVLQAGLAELSGEPIDPSMAERTDE